MTSVVLSVVLMFGVVISTLKMVAGTLVLTGGSSSFAVGFGSTTMAPTGEIVMYVVAFHLSGAALAPLWLLA